VRIGDAVLSPEVQFPALVPFLGAGHLALTEDARDSRVSGLLRALLLRLLAATPPGTLRVLPVDGGTVGATFAPFTALVEAGVIQSPATDPAGLDRVLTEAERHVQRA